MNNRPIKNVCCLKANESGMLCVFMPDGKQIPNTAGKTIEQDIDQSKSGFALVKLNIFCQVIPAGGVMPEPEPSPFTKSIDDVLNEIGNLQIEIDNLKPTENGDHIFLKVQKEARIDALRWMIS